ncbi:MAG: hypothetical protein MUF81_07785 [Verrucomicrobia bacterium]|nr:hypothetical protein [Verrucomicrobiota bacterium]
MQDSVLKWVKAVDTPVKPAEDREANGVRTLRYGPGSDVAEVVFITIEGQGHVWPGGKNLLPEFMVGKATDKLKAVDVIWEFFQAHPMKPVAAPASAHHCQSHETPAVLPRHIAECPGCHDRERRPSRVCRHAAQGRHALPRYHANH